MNRRDSTYPSRVDPWVAVLLVLTAAVSLVAVWALLSAVDRIGIVVGGLTLAVLLGTALVVYPVSYTIGERELVIRSGVWRIRVPLDSIIRVQPSRTLLASPALSLDRLAIEYHTDRFSRPTVYISPVRRDEFADRLADAAGLQRRGKAWVRSDA
jgi:hypothetical protein